MSCIIINILLGYYLARVKLYLKNFYNVGSCYCNAESVPRELRQAADTAETYLTGCISQLVHCLRANRLARENAIKFLL